MIYQQYRFAHGYPGFMGSAGWFTYERRFVEWAEAQGLQFDYAVSSDLELDPGTVDGYDLVLGVGHDEYWSAGQRAAVEDARAPAAATTPACRATPCSGRCGWRTTVDTMVCHKYKRPRDDPVVGTEAQATMTGMWCDPLVGRPETAFLGAGSAYGLYSRFGAATPRGSGAFTVYRDDHWLFAGTGLRYGDLLGADDGVVGYETVGCRLAFDDVPAAGRRRRRRHARRCRGRGVHPVVEPGDGRVPGVDRRARRPGRPRVHRLPPLRRRRRRLAGARAVTATP